MKIYYIGSFPPIYGGVTVKNENLYHELSKRLSVQKIDMNRIKRGNVKEMLRFIWAVLAGKQYIIGLAGQKNRQLITKFLYCFRRKAMSRSILLVMGGVVDDVIHAGADFIRKFNVYRKTYVELPGMLKTLEKVGVGNAAIYPNGRPRPKELPSLNVGVKPLKCVFFSIIQPEKGVDLIFEAAQMLPQIQFHFFGEVRKDYKQDFFAAIQSTENAVYHGVFTGDANAVYQELSQYDVMLLPTRWKTEGLPGVLIESKIAGLPAVVSDHNFNKEIVSHNYDGIVVQEVTAEKLAFVLKELDKDRVKLYNMRLASRASAEQYYLDACVTKVIQELERE